MEIHFIVYLVHIDLFSNSTIFVLIILINQISTCKKYAEKYKIKMLKICIRIIHMFTNDLFIVQKVSITSTGDESKYIKIYIQ